MEGRQRGFFASPFFAREWHESHFAWSTNQIWTSLRATTLAEATRTPAG